MLNIFSWTIFLSFIVSVIWFIIQLIKKKKVKIPIILFCFSVSEFIFFITYSAYAEKTFGDDFNPLNLPLVFLNVVCITLVLSGIIWLIYNIAKKRNTQRPWLLIIVSNIVNFASFGCQIIIINDNIAEEKNALIKIVVIELGSIIYLIYLLLKGKKNIKSSKQKKRQDEFTDDSDINEQQIINS
jgi:4-amino-4-deoxy-L-arabinose transferase-like glycosyltransferase